MKEKTKKILYVDMDNVLVDFMSGVRQVPESLVQQYEGRLDEIPGVFGLMKPMDGAIEAYEHLAKMFDTYILSTSPWENPSAWQDKVLWVQKYLGTAAYKRLILTHHKNLNRGDYLVDDRTRNGAGEFEGELILFGSDEFPGWGDVVEYLGSLVG